MDNEAVRNALSLLEGTLSRATDALSQLEAEAFGAPDSETEPIGFESPSDALGSLLDELKESTAIILDAAGMQATIISLNSAWIKFKADKDGA